MFFVFVFIHNQNQSPQKVTFDFNLACEQALCLGEKIARKGTKGLFTG